MLLSRYGVFVYWMELESVKLFVLWVLFLLLPSSMWTNSPSRHEPLLLHAFGRSEGLFGSPSWCCYYWGLLPSWRHGSPCDCWRGGAGQVVCSTRNPWWGELIALPKDYRQTGFLAMTLAWGFLVFAASSASSRLLATISSFQVLPPE